MRSSLPAATRDIAAETRALRMLHWPDMRTPAQKRKDVDAFLAGGVSAIAAAADAAEAVAVPRRRAAREAALAAAALAPPLAWQQQLLLLGMGGGGSGGAGPIALEGGAMGAGVLGGGVKVEKGGMGGEGGVGADSAAVATVTAGGTALVVEGGIGKTQAKEGPESLSPRCVRERGGVKKRAGERTAVNSVR